MTEHGDDAARLLRRAAEHAIDFRLGVDGRPVRAGADAAELRDRLGGPVPEAPIDAGAVIDDLVTASTDGLVAMAGPRYFGFVIGGSLPVAVAADWLTSAWDQNAGLFVGGPAAAIVEEVAGAWMLDLLGVPPTASFAFVTGCQMAHVTALAAARQHVLAATGWDVTTQGLAGSPPITVFVGEERHVTIDRALRLLGIGTAGIVSVPADGQGRMIAPELAKAMASADLGPTVVCAQVGNVDTGACDPLDEIVDAAQENGAWVHVDGAFGLWAAASPERAYLVAGCERADSWTTDAHKWLNVPYDSGFAAIAHPEPHRTAFAVRPPYLEFAAGDRPPRDQLDWTPEFSRRARGFPVYAALRHLGRSGVAELIERTCAHARHFAARFQAGGAEVLNEVVLNQVLVDFGGLDRNRALISAVQEEGTCWLSGTTWRGRSAARVSVSGWSTTEEDVDRSADAILRAFATLR
ncbi:MAG TPA: pyridoxal-dependent decarboxylase [Acidimicrobiales bacterium]|nr:pyridoxal-dependent decarboxylase [Acidimicrobiales bacterium]